jgi:HAD superfamily hydrolase (TIGR01450 family)
MKAVILAAGVGSRLRPITHQKPKTLVEVNQKSMLAHIIESLRGNKVKDLVVCVGYKAQEVINFCLSKYPELSFRFVINHRFDETNNMYSLYLAREYFTEDILLMNADLVFEPEIITTLLKQKKSSVAVDKGRYLEEAMKLVVEKNIITRISKKITPQDAYGSSIDVYRLNKDDLDTVTLEMVRIIEDEKDENQWTEVMLDNLFKSGKLIAKPMDIKGKKWYEIDNYDDLAAAEVLFNTKLKDLKKKKIFFLDRDGTVTLGNKALSGAQEFLNKVEKQKRTFYICTNNSSKTKFEHYENFTKKGLKIKKRNVLVSLDAALNYFSTQGYKNIYWVATKKVTKYIEDQGFTLEKKKPDAALLTYDTQLNYKKLVQLTHLIRAGVPYYATHPDIVCPTTKGSIPDIGTFIKIMELTTGQLPNKIFGKPNFSFVEPILQKHKLKSEDAVIIGDRLYTDISLANDNNMTSVLVLSGETTRGDYEFSDQKADIVVPSLQTLIDLL